MTIHVTEQDIAAGTPGHPSRCPIGLALTRYTGRTWIVEPTCVHEDGLLFEVALPQSAERFQSRFDFGDPVEPFSFEFNPTAIR
jgi:hypothetical protein